MDGPKKAELDDTGLIFSNRSLVPHFAHLTGSGPGGWNMQSDKQDHLTGSFGKEKINKNELRRHISLRFVQLRDCGQVWSSPRNYKLESSAMHILRK